MVTGSSGSGPRGLRGACFGVRRFGCLAVSRFAISNSLGMNNRVRVAGPPSPRTEQRLPQLEDDGENRLFVSDSVEFGGHRA
jgi:hypothetical protein